MEHGRPEDTSGPQMSRHWKHSQVEKKAASNTPILLSEWKTARTLSPKLLYQTRCQPLNIQTAKNINQSQSMISTILANGFQSVDFQPTVCHIVGKDIDFSAISCFDPISIGHNYQCYWDTFLWQKRTLEWAEADNPLSTRAMIRQ